MFWAAGRKTTRVEDTAYCLMGLFGVNMPLLYGEGHKAFIRLQEEIMRHSNDMSIFAWEATTSDYGIDLKGDEIMGLLARSPDAFADSNFNSTRTNTFGHEFSLTNRGIRVSAGNVRAHGGSDEFILCLSQTLLYSDCGRELLGVAIRPIGGGLFVRSQPELLLQECPRRDYAISPTADLHLVTELTSKVRFAHGLVNNQTIRVPQLEEVGLHCTGIFPQLQYQYDSNRFITQGCDAAVGYATYRSRLPGNKEYGRHADDLVIFLGLDDYRTPWCRVSSPDHYPGWSNEWGAQEDNLKRYSSVAYRERGLDWELEIGRSSNESQRSAIVVRHQFYPDGDQGHDLKLIFEEEVRSQWPLY